MAQPGRSPVNRFGRIKLARGLIAATMLYGGAAVAEDLVRPQPKKTIKVPAVQLAYKNDRMNEPLLIKREEQQPGAIVGDALNFVAMGADLPTDSSRYTWSGFVTGEGIAKTAIYSVNGDPEMTLSVFDRNSNRNKSFVEKTRVRFVGPETEPDICIAGNIIEVANCAIVLIDSQLADEWSETGGMGARLGFGAGPCNADDGKCNAAKHAYWNLLMVRDTNLDFATRLATAHERFSNGYFFINDSGIDAGSAHNSIVMDLANNLVGRNLFGSFPSNTAWPNHDEQGKTEIVSLINIGVLTIMDPLPNPNSGPHISSSFLVPSNTQPNQ